MSLYETIRVLYYNWKVIILACFVPTVAAIYFTSNMEKMYQSSAMLYTGIASGYSIESSEGQRIDYHVVNNAFDNLISLIKSRQTMEEVGLRLLARHLMITKPTHQIGKEAHDQLMLSYPQANRSWVDTADFEITLSRLVRRFRENTDKTINSLVLGDGGAYSLKTLGKLEAKRVKSSDMVQLIYQYSDAGIAQGTLAELLDVFVSRYKDLKTAETGNVVAYFEQRLATIKTKLTAAEDKLTVFRSEHRVINYGEQTKAIAIKKQNALEEYASLKMNLQATKAALKKIEEKLKIRENVLSRNAQLLEKKQALTDITSQIAMGEASENDVKIQSMLQQQARLREEINNDLHQLFNYSNTKEGLPSQQLLNDWLSHLITTKKEEVHVALFGKRLADLNAEYDRFAPLGSTIDRYEREIDVFEREYLEVLHGLNMAKLKQQNIQLSSTLNVLDAPKYPTSPQSSKRMLLVALSFMVGLVGSVGSILAIEMLDNTLREPVHAEQVTQLPVISAIPAIDEKSKRHSDIKQVVLEQVIDRVQFHLSPANHKPAIVTLASMNAGTCKSHIGQLLVAQLHKQAVQASLIEKDQFSNLSNAINESQKKGDDILFIELAPLSLGKINLDLLSQSHLNLLVERADRSWSQAHKRTLQHLFQALGYDAIQLLLNGMKFRFVEDVIGELPERSNSLKSIVKRVLKFEKPVTGLNS